MKNILRKAFLIIIAIILLNSFIISTNAINFDIDNTDLRQDIEEMLHLDYEEYKESFYQINYIKLIMFLEYNYDEEYDSNKYNAYVYIYNPAGIEIKENSVYITIATKNKDGTFSTPQKYQLQFVKKSIESNYENTIYKFKIINRAELYAKAYGTRTYRIDSIELQHKGISEPKKYNVKGTFTFSGYTYINGVQGNLQYRIDDFVPLARHEEKETANTQIDTISFEEESEQAPRNNKNIKEENLIIRLIAILIITIPIIIIIYFVIKITKKQQEEIAQQEKIDTEQKQKLLLAKQIKEEEQKYLLKKQKAIEEQKTSKATKSTSEENNMNQNNQNRCKICGQPCGIYDICRECKKDIEDGKVKQCPKCLNYYLAGTICKCTSNNTYNTYQQKDFNNNHYDDNTSNNSNTHNTYNTYNTTSENQESSFNKGFKATMGGGCGCVTFIILGIVVLALILASIFK